MAGMDDARIDEEGHMDVDGDPDVPEEEPAFTSEIPVSNLAREMASDRQNALSDRAVHEFIAEARINVPTRGNRTLEQVIERINASEPGGT